MISSEFTLKLQFLIQINTQESTQSTVGASLYSVFHHFLFNTSQYQQRAHHEDGRLLLMIWWPNRPNFLIAQNKQRFDFSGYHTACAKQWHGSNKSSGGCVFLKPRTKVRTPSFLNVKNCSKPQQGRFLVLPWKLVRVMWYYCHQYTLWHQECLINHLSLARRFHHWHV